MIAAPFTTQRIFKAPLALLWQVHTSPDHQAKWLSPGNPAGYVSQMDFRVGGRHFYGMPGPDGALIYGLQHFLEIEPLQRVVLLQSFADAAGNIAPHPLAPTWPRAMLSTNLYQDMGDGTSKLTITWTPHEATDTEIATFEAARGGMEGGWAHQFGQIEAYLSSL